MVDYKLALKYAKLVQLTELECTGNCTSELNKALLALGYVPLKCVYGSELATYLDTDAGSELPYGYVAYSISEGDIVVALRCTETRLEILQDLMFMPIPLLMPNAGIALVAAGFSSLYKSLRVGVEPHAETLIGYLKDRKFSKVAIAGHSLGAALATLLALDVNVNIPALAGTPLYTYGSPRVGGLLFAMKFNKYVKNSYRVVERWDPIQAVPILPVYYHVNEKEVIRGSWSLNPLEHHHIATYISILERMQNGLL